MSLMTSELAPITTFLQILIESMTVVPAPMNTLSEIFTPPQIVAFVVR